MENKNIIINKNNISITLVPYNNKFYIQGSYKENNSTTDVVLYDLVFSSKEEANNYIVANYDYVIDGLAREIKKILAKEPTKNYLPAANSQEIAILDKNDKVIPTGKQKVTTGETTKKSIQQQNNKPVDYKRIVPVNSYKEPVDRHKENNDESKDHNVLRGKLVMFGCGALTGAILVGTIAGKCCGSCKSTKNSYNPYPTRTPYTTQAPTEEESKTEVPSPTPDSLTVEVIEDMAHEKLLYYMQKNEKLGEITGVIDSEGNLVNFQLEEADIVNAYTILNVDDLSHEHYPTFRALIPETDLNGYYDRNEYFMFSCMMKNIYVFNEKRYDKKYTGPCPTEHFIWFSPLLLNDDDRAEMEKLEKIMEEVAELNFRYDAEVQDEHEYITNKTVDLVREFISEVNENIVNRKRSNGLYHIVAIYCSTLKTLGKDTMGDMLLASLEDLEPIYQKKAYEGTMSILDPANTNDYGCYVAEEKHIRTRHI